MKPSAALIGLSMLAALPRQAAAWGDQGHEVVALIAQSYLEPEARKQVNALLAADTDNLTAHDIASAATWADRYREANIDGSRARTRQWGRLKQALSRSGAVISISTKCPRLPVGTVAANGPAADCVVGKIEQFAAELATRLLTPKSRSWR
jgi:hypothetical protein